MENIHLWKAGRSTYYDRNINIITWSDEYFIKVGNYCSIGRDCNFFLHANHRPDWITTSSLVLGPVTPEIDTFLMERGHPGCKGNIEIGNDVWIGAKSTIMSGVKIGDGAVIGAGSVIAKDVPPYTIWVGNPAKMIKKRFTDEQIEKLLKLKWWNWSENQVREEASLLWSNNLDKFLEKYGS
jgi:acetyltransferase-like isoleucine patch superfamily enzyme